MMESKIEKKYFGIAEFAEEEKWLEYQHKNGWCLIKTNRNKYQFERCNNDEWVYQIDFKENTLVEEDYIQMFKDCGWEYVVQCGRWFYFRKKKEGSVDLSIFSDRSSRIDLYARMLKSRQLVVAVALFVIACIIEWLTIFTKFFKGDSLFDSALPWIGVFFDSALPWIGMGLLVATGFSSKQYIKLRKMVENLK